MIERIDHVNLIVYCRDPEGNLLELCALGAGLGPRGPK